MAGTDESSTAEDGVPDGDMAGTGESSTAVPIAAKVRLGCGVSTHEWGEARDTQKVSGSELSWAWSGLCIHCGAASAEWDWQGSSHVKTAISGGAQKSGIGELRTRGCTVLSRDGGLFARGQERSEDTLIFFSFYVLGWRGIFRFSGEGRWSAFSPCAQAPRRLVHLRPWGHGLRRRVVCRRILPGARYVWLRLHPRRCVRDTSGILRGRGAQSGCRGATRCVIWPPRVWLPSSYVLPIVSPDCQVSRQRSRHGALSTFSGWR